MTMTTPTILAFLFAIGAMAADGVSAQNPPPILLEGRESVEQMKKFEPFLGTWTRVESPPGTPIPATTGGCSWTVANHGMSVDAACGPAGDPAEATRIFWHPIERRFVFRLFSIRNPVDLLFDGEYDFPATGTMRRTYKGYYGDGRIHVYRETWTLEGRDRLQQKTEHFTKGEWTQIFGGSVYSKARSQSSNQLTTTSCLASP
jgi:hypothetical protein